MADSESGTKALTTTTQPQRSLNRQVVLEEDEYTTALSKIIARDFFPSLAHLEATNTFLDSIDSQDPARIEESVRRLSDLRAATPQTQHRSSWSQSTPYARTPYDTPLRTPRAGASSSAGESSKPKVDMSLSLDAFQAKYTSEDNSSFTEILDEENRLRKQKYGWAWEAERRAGERKAKEIVGRERLLIEATGTSGSQLLIEGRSTAAIEAPPSTDAADAATSSESSASTSQALVFAAPKDESEPSEPIDVMAPRKDTRSAIVPSWKFKNRNSLMFSPDADESPYHQPIPKIPTNPDGSPALPKEAGRVVHSATRLPAQSEEAPSPSPSVPPSPTHSRIAAAISGTPYPVRPVTDTPKVGGFGFVDALPSPSPSELGPEAMKELMTWGTLLGTPRIIRGDDDDPSAEAESSSSGAQNPFTINQPSARDALGRRLGGQASKSLREKAAVASGAHQTPRGAKRKHASDMPPPEFTPRRAADIHGLSPAARLLLGRTKTGNALGLTPRETAPSSGLGPPSGGGRGAGKRGARELDLRKVGWSPMATPDARERSRSRGNGGPGGRRDR